MQKIKESKIQKGERKLRVKFQPIKSLLRMFYWLLIGGFFLVVLYLGIEAFLAVYDMQQTTEQQEIKAAKKNKN